MSDTKTHPCRPIAERAMRIGIESFCTTATALLTLTLADYAISDTPTLWSAIGFVSYFGVVLVSVPLSILSGMRVWMVVSIACTLNACVFAVESSYLVWLCHRIL